MKLLRNRKEIVDGKAVKTTELVIPIKKKISTGESVSRSIFGIEYSRKRIASPDESFVGNENKRESVIFLVGCHDGRSERYYVWDMCDALRSNNIDAKYLYHPFTISDKELSVCSAIVFFRLAPKGESKEILDDLLCRAEKYNVPCIFSVDDLIFDDSVISQFPTYDSWSEKDLQNVKDDCESYKEIIRACDSVFVSTDYLAERARRFVSDVRVFSCFISEKQYKVAQSLNKSKKHKNTVDICYLSGTATHNKDFLIAEAALVEILKKYSNVRLVIVGPLSLSKQFEEFGQRIVRYNLMDYKKLIKFTATMDINIAPLDYSNVFVKSKTALKITEAGIVRVPTVASPIPAYEQCIEQGKNGFIAHDHNEWVRCLSLLIEDERLREKLGEEAYKFASSNYLVKDNVERFITSIREIKKNKISSRLNYNSWLEKKFSAKTDKKINIKCLDIAFLIPTPMAGSGGQRNIFRAVSHLKRSGHNLTIYYMGSETPANRMKRNCSNWFYDMTGVNFVKYEGTLGFHDVAVATYWTTAYEIDKYASHFALKFYFAQDFEAVFQPMSSDYVLAENSYRLGFYHICSGPWMHSCITKRFGAKSDFFQFPVDKTVYNTSQPREKRNKNIIFFARPEMPRRCYEIGIRALKVFSELVPDVEIILFGSSRIVKERIPFKCTIKGLLPSISDLADLYRNADFGIVFSTTNPSLVPYEMMACGCPVGDLDYDDALSKYGNSENNVFLLDPIPSKMGHELAEIINDTERLKLKSSCAKEFVEKEFPTEEQMGNKVESIILEQVKNIL